VKNIADRRRRGFDCVPANRHSAVTTPASVSSRRRAGGVSAIRHSLAASASTVHHHRHPHPHPRHPHHHHHQHQQQQQHHGLDSTVVLDPLAFQTRVATAEYVTTAINSPRYIAT